MKRYRLRYSQQTRTAQRSDTTMVEDPNGEWVRYVDVRPDQATLNAHDLKQCTVCSVEFNEDEEPGILGYFGIIPVTFCTTCTACVYDLADTLLGGEEDERKD